MQRTNSSSRSQPRTVMDAYGNLENHPRIADISRGADLLLSQLVRHCDQRTGVLEKSHSYMAEKFRRSTRTLRRRLVELRDAGFIEYEPGNGRGNLTRIRLRLES